MGPLITANELLARVGDPALVMIDVRWNLAGPPGIDEFRAGHIPGAHYLDLDTELAAPAGSAGRHPAPDPSVVGAALRRCGVGSESLVVIYDANAGMSAARAWWVLRDVGVGQAAVLDGGVGAWIAAGGDLQHGDQEPGAGAFEPTAPRLPRLDAEGAAWVAANGVLLDARTPERYRGEQEPIDPVAGHIPGAVNLPSAEHVGPDGTFLAPELLRERFASMGIDDETIVGTYCGSGVTAAHQLLALTIAGYDASLYVGSWSEWIADPARPVATGDEYR